MIAAKKQSNSELLTLALLLSLLRPEAVPPPWPPPLARSGVQLGLGGLARALWGLPTGPAPRSTLKNLLLNDEDVHNRYHSLLSELATLARPPSRMIEDEFEWPQASVATYLLTELSPGEGGGEAPAEAPPPAQPPPPPQPPEDLLLQNTTAAHDLSDEDMNLIEVLWKQDVDLGVPPLGGGDETPPEAVKPPPDVKVEADDPDEGPLTALDPWAGLPYTIDLETGEYELCKSEEESGVGGAEGVDLLSGGADDVEFDLPTALDAFSLEDALKIASLDDSQHDPVKEEEEEELGAMSGGGHPAAGQHPLHPHHHHLYAPKPHHLSAEGRMPMVVRGGGGWADVGGGGFEGVGDALGPPPPHHHHHHQFTSTYLPDPRSVLLHNATLAPPPPLPEFNASAPLFGGNASFCGVRGGGGCGGVAGAGSHLGSAVAASMNLSAPEGLPPPSEPPFKLDNDAMYYQNASGGESLNHTSSEGFFNSILNDEELQLVDMAMNEGMYTMRLLDNSTGVGAAAAPAGDADGSSDSAVSSMGSERAWGTEPSTSSSYLDYCSSGQNGCKYRPYDYSGSAYAGGGPRGSGGGGGGGGGGNGAQKKHHMFAKRYFNETNEPKCVDFREGPSGAPVGAAGTPAGPLAEHVAHNHTYGLPGGLPEPHPRRPTRDKNKHSKDEHLTRDEKRARAMQVPISVEEIINLPMDEFNERLSKFDLTEAQLSLIRDIRRRGKNKVAAQNCRKRKLDQIMSLADEVKIMRHRKHRLLRDKECMLSERQRLKDKFAQLYRHVFQALRDAEGRPYSPYEFSLQQAADGSVLLVPRKDDKQDLSRRP
ncbi:segmentation protein cap'n'collar isoform X2 [Neocloeon triangulifer]|uniref:segmentation protein cap'n'collar isoform X2 n=1 Tax=Neocloeon triangulifer TaxID=2078957 RepID=UPI00286EBCE3|nr:segmentation protein cap'n'collar isoform X2 [Neocloeon triangulifer]